MNTRRRPSAFTLIELLVVIAIIALLAAILLPALNSARLKGYDADCSGNLKQLGTALYQYATTRDGYFPKVRSMTESYFGAQNELLDAIGDAVDTNSISWYCKRYLKVDGIDRVKAMAKAEIGYFYFAWALGSSSSILPVDIAGTSNIWHTQTWNTNMTGMVLMSDRFRDKAAWAQPSDWQYHGGSSVEISLQSPGTLVLLSGGGVQKIAPKPPP